MATCIFRKAKIYVNGGANCITRGGCWRFGVCPDSDLCECHRVSFYPGKIAFFHCHYILGFALKNVCICTFVKMFAYVNILVLAAHAPPCLHYPELILDSLYLFRYFQIWKNLTRWCRRFGDFSSGHYSLNYYKTCIMNSIMHPAGKIQLYQT